MGSDGEQHATGISAPFSPKSLAFFLTSPSVLSKILAFSQLPKLVAFISDKLAPAADGEDVHRAQTSPPL